MSSAVYHCVMFSRYMARWHCVNVGTLNSLSVLFWPSQVEHFFFAKHCPFHSTFLRSNIRVKKDSLTWHLTSVYLSKSVLKYVFCFFVGFGFIVPLENFSLIWRRHYYRRRAANYLPMLGTDVNWAMRVL